jgi:predicted DNA-binding antitoxin AbrB/MazE fold protein
LPCKSGSCIRSSWDNRVPAKVITLSWEAGLCREVQGSGLIAKRMTIAAKYEDGVFKPLEDVTINEGTIVEVRVPSYADRLKAKSRSVQGLAFYGIWKDRRDIVDSIGYIDDLRRNIRA